jgi:glycosyltransferase involved in cell wall biosynthesis
MSDVTIGFIPRERFSLAPESLQSILEHTDVPFNLVVVDCNMPEAFRRPVDQLLEGRSNVTIVRSDEYLLPNECRNLVVREAKGEFLCLIENDNLVSDGWLSRFVSAMETHEAGAVIPLILEGRPGDDKVHFDDNLGSVEIVETPEGIKWEVRPRPGRKENDLGAASRFEVFMETHCLFFRRSVLDRIGPFDEALNTSEEIDVSLSLYSAKVPAVFAPECVVRYIQPPQPVCRDDLGYFLHKWDIDAAHRSHRYLQQKWKLVRMPQLVGFVEERNRRGSGSLHVWRDELETLVPGGDALILVDEAQWEGTDAVAGLRCVPFTERDGQYWGPPADDEAAIRELERLRPSAGAIAFAWHAFWWFDYYREFYRYLCRNFRRVLDNEHVVAFDLRA